MRSVCVVRRSPEWRRWQLKNSHHVQRASELWDRTFETSYVDFRKSLSQISEDNRKQIPFDVVCDIHECEKYLDQPHNLIFPTDDDDWYRPDILDVVSKFAGEGPACEWNHARFDLNVLTEALNDPFQSNTYAAETPVDYLVVKNHVVAGAKFRQEGYRHIGSVLSVYNHSLASLSTLKKIDGPQGLLERYDLCLNELLRVGTVPDVFEEYVGRVRELYKSLNPRAIIKL